MEVLYFEPKGVFCISNTRFLRVLSSKIIVANTKNGLSYSIVKIVVTPPDLVEYLVTLFGVKQWYYCLVKMHGNLNLRTKPRGATFLARLNLGGLT